MVGISASVGLLETAGVSLAQEANDVAGQLTEFEFEFAPQGALPSGCFTDCSSQKAFGFAKSPPCKSIRVGSSRLSGTAVCVLNTENKVWDFVDVYELSGTVPAEMEHQWESLFQQLILVSKPLQDLLVCLSRSS